MLLALGLGDPRLWPAVLAKISPEQCEVAYVRQCLSWVAAQVASGTLPGLAELSAAIRDGPHDLEFLAELRAQFPGPQALEYWTRLVAEAAERRGLESLSRRMWSEAHSSEKTPFEVAAEAARALSELVSGQALDHVLAPEGWLAEFWTELERRAREGAAKLVVPTGMATLDSEVGVEPGDLVIVAAETGVGKSAFALSAARAAASEGRVVLYANTEMSAYQLASRILGAESGIPVSDLRRGELRAQDWDRLAQVRERVSQQKLYITRPLSGMAIGELAILARAHQAQHGLDVLVVDYVGRLDTTGGRDEREYQVLEGISKQLKGLAQDLGCVVYMLAQRTEDGHIAGSRRMRNDADLVLEIVPIDDDNRLDAPDDATHWLAITKARNAPGDYSVAVKFEPHRMRWVELSRLGEVARHVHGGRSR